ncbi:MAG: TolC family protein, partial [Xanthomonadales bacterium]|nr:TolC family protein [Xanthomonadales bacterium]
MCIRSAAVAALVVVSCGPALARADAALTLEDAYARVLAHHPDLAALAPMREAAEAEAVTAALAPQRRLVAEVENVAGSGERSGIRAAEATIGLASLFERGGKRAARGAVASARVDAIATEADARRIDLLAEVARRYLDVVAAEVTRAIGEADVEQRERAVAAATRRVRAGASPESVRLAADAEHARARLDRDRAVRERETAFRRLAILWRAHDGDVTTLAVQSLAIPDVPRFDAIARELERSPGLRRFADAARLREARLQLARSAQA